MPRLTVHRDTMDGVPSTRDTYTRRPRLLVTEQSGAQSSKLKGLGYNGAAAVLEKDPRQSRVRFNVPK